MDDSKQDVYLLWLHSNPRPYASKVYTTKGSPIPLSVEEKKNVSLSVKLKPEEYEFPIAALEAIYPYVPKIYEPPHKSLENFGVAEFVTELVHGIDCSLIKYMKIDK